MFGHIHSSRKAYTMTSSTERAVLAGGCFWGMQDLIRKMPGVISTRVGYSGGDVANATYRHHGTHAEAIEIVFDPRIISYRTLLEFFFQIHDPTTRNRQGNDVGMSYRSAIFYLDDEQKGVAEDTIADVEASGLWPGKVVTELAPVGPFWEAEPEHQDYLEHYPDGYTCHFVRPGWKLPRRADAKASERARPTPPSSPSNPSLLERHHKPSRRTPAGRAKTSDVEARPIAIVARTAVVAKADWAAIR
jgi:peptide-methionine (S)-S-oxide reductase